MNCKETAVDIREMTPEELALAGKQTELLFKLKAIPHNSGVRIAQ